MSAMNVCQVLAIHLSVVPLQWRHNERDGVSNHQHLDLSVVPLQWRHNERDGVSNHQHLDCLLSRLLRCTSKKSSKLLVTGHCEGNPPVVSEFPSQRASDAENVFLWWRHRIHIKPLMKVVLLTCLTSSLKFPSFFHKEKLPDDYVSMMMSYYPNLILNHISTRLTPGLHPADERRRYKVTPSLIGWEQS